MLLKGGIKQQCMAENNQCGEWHKETTWELCRESRPEVTVSGKAGGNKDVER